MQWMHEVMLPPDQKHTWLYGNAPAREAVSRLVRSIGYFGNFFKGFITKSGGMYGSEENNNIM